MDYILAAHIRVTGGEAAAAELRKVDQAAANLGRQTGGTGITGNLNQANEASTRLAGGIGRVQDAMIRMATYTGLAAIAGGIYEGVKGVLDFDQAMTESLAIQSGVTDTMRGNMEDLAKTIAVDLGMAPKDAAEGFYFLASAGLNVEQQMAALPQVAAFAKAGMMDLEAATEMAYDALSALGLKVADPAQQLENLTRLTDVLTVAAIESQGTIEQFGEAIANKAGASMRTFGIDMEEGTALLAVFADQGIKGKVAGERFSMIIRDLGIKALKNGEAFRDMGIEVFDSGGKFNDLTTIFGQVDAALLPLTHEDRLQALLKLGFTMRDMSTIMSLLGKSDDLARFQVQLENAGGAAQRVADKQMESLLSKAKQLRSLAIVFAIEGFEKLQDAGLWLADTFTPAIDAVWDALARMAGGVGPVLEVFGSLAGGVVVGTLEGLAGALDLVFSTIADNQGFAEVLGAGLAGAVIIPQLGKLVDYLGGPLVRAFGDAQWAFSGFVQNFKAANLASSSGAIDALAGAFRAVGSALATLAVPAGFAAIGVGIYGVVSDFKKGEKAAEDFWNEVKGRHDMSSLKGISDALGEAQGKFQENEKWMSDNAGSWFEGFSRRGMSALDSLTPGFLDYKHNVIELAGEQDKLRDKMKEGDQAYVDNAVGMMILGQAFGGARVNVAKLSEALEESGTKIDTAKVGQVAAQLETMGIKAGIAKIPTEELGRQLRSLADQAGIKMEGPWEDWVPQLAEVYAKFTDVRQISSDLGGVAEGAGGKMSSFEEALFKIRDSASSAEEELKSLQTIMDTLTSDQGVFGADIAWQQSLVDLKKTLAETATEAGPNFDILTEGGRKVGSALIDAAEEARGMALAIAADQGVDAGIASLQGYAEGIAQTMRNAGATEEQVRTMIATLNLTPGEIETIMNMIQKGGDPADTKKKIDELDGSKATIAMEVIGGEDAGKILDQTASARYARLVALAEDTGKTDEELNTIAKKRDAIFQGIAQAEKADGALNIVARNRDAIMDALANPGTAPEDLDFVARLREALIRAEARGVEEARAMLESLERTYHARVLVTYQASYTGEPGNFALAQGGIVETYAKGGMREQHLAQIAPAGTWRVWGEPETGGEAYIPLGESKRARSMALWEEVGRRFGALPAPGGGGGGGQVVTMAPSINVSVTGGEGMDPQALANAVAQRTQVAVDQVMTRALVELRAR